MIGFFCGVCGVMLGVSITHLVAEWLACRAHAKWLKIVDRQERVIERLQIITNRNPCVDAKMKELKRLHSQRNRAWKILHDIQETLADDRHYDRQIAFLVAGAIGPADAEEYNAAIAAEAEDSTIEDEQRIDSNREASEAAGKEGE